MTSKEIRNDNCEGTGILKEEIEEPLEQKIQLDEHGRKQRKMKKKISSQTIRREKRKGKG